MLWPYMLKHELLFSNRLKHRLDRKLWLSMLKCKFWHGMLQHKLWHGDRAIIPSCQSRAIHATGEAWDFATADVKVNAITRRSCRYVFVLGAPPSRSLEGFCMQRVYLSILCAGVAKCP